MRNFAVAPGEYLGEWLEEHPEITQSRLADDLGVSRKQVNAILRGRAPISVQVAMRLEKVTPIPAKAWLAYQVSYDTELARIAEERELEKHADEITQHTAKYLRQIGATTATRRNPGQLYADLLVHTGCGSYAVFRRKCDGIFDGPDAVAALRESDADVDPVALLVWIAQAEKSLETRRTNAPRYSEEALLNVIPQIRSRAALPDADMLDDIQNLLASAGVLLLNCAPPEKFPLHGITYWVDGSPTVLYTERRKTDGYIVWAIFHELGHVLNDERSGGMYGLAKTKAQRTKEEKDANGFARKALFGSAGLSPFKGLTKSSEIRAAAQSVGVSPGVAVVAMHRKRMLDYRFGNDLLVDLS